MPSSTTLFVSRNTLLNQLIDKQREPLVETDQKIKALQKRRYEMAQAVRREFGRSTTAVKWPEAPDRPKTPRKKGFSYFSDRIPKDWMLARLPKYMSDMYFNRQAVNKLHFTRKQLRAQLSDSLEQLITGKSIAPYVDNQPENVPKPIDYLG